MKTYKITKKIWMANPLSDDEQLEVATWLKSIDASAESFDRLSRNPNVSIELDFMVGEDGSITISEHLPDCADGFCRL